MKPKLKEEKMLLPENRQRQFSIQIKDALSSNNVFHLVVWQDDVRLRTEWVTLPVIPQYT